MRVAVDTNVLAYAEGVNGEPKRATALEVLGKLPRESLVVPVQVLGELYNVLTRKAGRPLKSVRASLTRWQAGPMPVATSTQTLLAAVDLAGGHRISIWDAVILAAAAESGCSVLLSEDLQDGFHWRGVTVVNPFADPPHPLLANLFSS